MLRSLHNEQYQIDITKCNSPVVQSLPSHTNETEDDYYKDTRNQFWRLVIGKKGCNLIEMTQKYHLAFIYHNTQNNQMEYILYKEDASPYKILRIQKNLITLMARIFEMMLRNKKLPPLDIYEFIQNNFSFYEFTFPEWLYKSHHYHRRCINE